MITASDVELRAGARLLISATSFRVNRGDKIGLVGRNGAGKTMLAKVLAAEELPADGSVIRSGTVGYLPQDTGTGHRDTLTLDRILSGRGLDERLHPPGVSAVEAEAATIASCLGLPDRSLGQPLGTLSGCQRRRVELARILVGQAETLLLDEPTNHLPPDSVRWLRDFLRTRRGGVVVISHDPSLLGGVVNRVIHLDADRRRLDTYDAGWSAYQAQRAAGERRRWRELANADRQTGASQSRAGSMRAKATRAKVTRQWRRRARILLSGRAPAVRSCGSRWRSS